MHRLFLVLLTILSLAVVTSAADVAAGKEAFAKRCSTCHGTEGEGKDSIARMMKVELRHLGAKEVQGRSDADLQKITIEGTGKMRPVKDVDAKAAADIVAFIRTLRDKK